jgi:hypothetical protein
MVGAELKGKVVVIDDVLTRGVSGDVPFSGGTVGRGKKGGHEGEIDKIFGPDPNVFPPFLFLLPLP